MRAFSKLREMILIHKDLLVKMKELESKVANHNMSIVQIFAYLKQLVQTKNRPTEPIGFKRKDEY